MKKSKILFTLLLLFGIFQGGCSAPNQPKDAFLEEAKTVYENVSEQQGFPGQNLIRKDWPSDQSQLWENMYLYPIPYMPYFFRNVILAHGKEAIFLPISPFVGMENMDNSDIWLEQNALQYEQLFYKTWTEQNHANFVNMDQEPSKFQKN